MIRQIFRIIRLLGFGRAIKMKKRHEKGLAFVRGYAATQCWWALTHNGFLDELHHRGFADFRAFAKEHSLAPDVLEAVLEYLEGIGLLERSGEIVRLTNKGRDLLAEPRGLFDLLWAYESCFRNLPDLLAGSKAYGRDVHRDVTWVGIGSGRLCEQLPYPVMRRMVLEHGRRMVLDLGCGDLALLSGLCRMDREIRCHGIDCSADMVQFNRKELGKQDFEGRLTVQQADMFHLPPLLAGSELPPVDCITACDTFHEYLGNQEGQLIELLKSLKARFPGAIFVIGEFCKQDAGWLRRHPTASLEHHLFHELSLQKIGTARQWRDIFQKAGLSILEEEVFDMIGHGYFALR